MGDTRLKESGNQASFYRNRLEKAEPMLVTVLESGEMECGQVSHFLRETRADLGIHDLLGSSDERKHWSAELGARCGSALWRVAHLDGRRKFQFREFEIHLTGNPQTSEHTWFDSFLLAQIARSRTDLGILRAPLQRPGPGDDSFMAKMRQGISAHLRGDGERAAKAYIDAATAAHPDRADYRMDRDEMFDVFLPALQLWDVIFRGDATDLEDKLIEACDAHRHWYRIQNRLFSPDSFVCLSAWAARSWAFELGWDVDTNDSHLPPVLSIDAA